MMTAAAPSVVGQQSNKSEWATNQRRIDYLVFCDFHLEVGFWAHRTIVVILHRHFGKSAFVDAIGREIAVRCHRKQ